MPTRRRSWRWRTLIRGTDHFGHREAAGTVVDLFWDRGDLHDEFVGQVLP